MEDTTVICPILCMAEAERPRLSFTPGSTLSAIAWDDRDSSHTFVKLRWA